MNLDQAPDRPRPFLAMYRRAHERALAHEWRSACGTPGPIPAGAWRAMAALWRTEAPARVGDDS